MFAKAVTISAKAATINAKAATMCAKLATTIDVIEIMIRINFGLYVFKNMFYLPRILLHKQLACQDFLYDRGVRLLVKPPLTIPPD